MSWYKQHLYSIYRDVIAKYLFPIKHGIYALLLFLPTLLWLNEKYFLLLPLFILLLDFKSVKATFFTTFSIKRRKQILFLIAVFVIGATLNKFSFGLPIICLRDYYAWFLLFPILFFVGLQLKDLRFSKLFILLVAIEVLVSLAEYGLQMRSFFLSDLIPIDLKSNFLYDHRVYGLSINSSVVSFKIFGALLLLSLSPMKKWQYVTLLVILYAGALVTFNRALIITILFLNTIYFFSGFIHVFANWKRTISTTIPTLTFLCVFLLLAKNNLWTELNKRHPETKQLSLANRKTSPNEAHSFSCAEPYQPILQTGKQLDTTNFFNRILIKRTEQVNTSGRTLIWANYIAFISNNFWFGNGSDKLYFREINPTTGSKKLIHAHNSFLQLVATNGILISGIFLLLLYLMWQKKHLLLLASLLLFSLFQYGVFWGFSMLDVIFISLILSDFKSTNETH